MCCRAGWASSCYILAVLGIANICPMDGSTEGGVKTGLTRLSRGSAAAAKLGGRKRICLSQWRCFPGVDVRPCWSLDLSVFYKLKRTQEGLFHFHQEHHARNTQACVVGGPRHRITRLNQGRCKLSASAEVPRGGGAKTLLPQGGSSEKPRPAQRSAEPTARAYARSYDIGLWSQQDGGIGSWSTDTSNTTLPTNQI